MSFHVHHLAGCSPRPLASYLKALGILRIVAEQKDSTARGFWREEAFSLVTSLDEPSLLRFFLEEWQPTPIVSPWNKGSGFFDPNDKGLAPIRRSVAPRFAPLREGVEAAASLVADMEAAVTAEKEIKAEAKAIKDGAAREALRADPVYKARLAGAARECKRLEDELQPECQRRWRGGALRWLRAAVVLHGDEKPEFPALLGTGGNDGKLDFTNNAYQRLADLFDLSSASGGPRPGVEDMLGTALFGGPPGPRWEPVRVLCPQSAAEYASWKAAATRRIEDEFALPPGKKPTAKLKRDRERALAPFPADLVGALCVDTGWLQDHGWSSAPGSRELVYWRPADALEVGPPPTHRTRGLPTVPFILVSVSTSTRNRSALPIEERVFPQGRLLHKALAAAIERVGAGGQALWLLGRDRDQAAATGHRHAHLLHLDLDDDGRLDHALVWAPAGLDAEAQRVVRAVRRTWMKGGVGELQVAVVATGGADDLRDLDAMFDGCLFSSVGTSHRWISATPYVAPRMTKHRGKDSLIGQVQEALRRRELPAAEVEVLSPHGDLRKSFRHFVLHDQTYRPPMPITHALRLTFPEAVPGPICLGYGSHFGLGRFQVDPGA